MQKGALKKTIEGVNGPEIQKLLDNIWQKLSRAKKYWHTPDPVVSVEELGRVGNVAWMAAKQDTANSTAC